MSEELACCPACRAVLRVETNGRGPVLEIVRMTKPDEGERWGPTPAEAALRRRADRLERRLAERPVVRIFRRPRRRPETPGCRDAQEAVERVAARYGLTVEQLRSPYRGPSLVRARWEAMAAAREAGASLAEIGDALDRDHTTVLHGLRQLARAS